LRLSAWTGTPRSSPREDDVFANYLIGLREGLEAALVVSILIAYLIKSGRGDQLRPIWAGVGAAVALSLAFGALLTFTSNQLSFQAQEFFGGALSIIAVGFVTWMIFWMRRAARQLSASLRSRVEAAVTVGAGALALTAAIAVGREGLETSLFLWAAIQASGQTTQPVIGASLGLLSAVVLAYLIYRGSLRIDLARFFTWTGAALIVVAAGVLAYGVHDLQEAAVLPGLNSLAFDVSDTIAPNSWYGALLRGLLNFTPVTTWAQAIVWVLYVSVVAALFFRSSTSSRRASRSTPQPSAR
jgi:high-affinity iron transporter